MTECTRRRFMITGTAAIAAGLGTSCAGRRSALITAPGASATADGLTVRLNSMRGSDVDGRALQVDLALRNDGDAALSFSQRHVELVDAHGRTVPAVQNTPFHVQTQEGGGDFFSPSDSTGLRVVKVIFFPVALIAGMIASPVTATMAVVDRVRAEKSKWQPFYSDTVVLASVEPKTEEVTRLYFDTSDLDANELAAIPVKHPATGKIAEVRWRR